MMELEQKTVKSRLTKKEKLQVFLRLCEEHKISGNSIATSLNMGPSGILRIIKGETKKPHESTINNLYDYVVKKYEPLDKKENPISLSDYSPREIMAYVIKNRWKFEQEVTFQQFEEMSYYRYNDRKRHSDLERQILKIGKAVNSLARGEKLEKDLLEEVTLDQ